MKQHRRSLRTRQALVEAFGRLVLRRHRHIRVADVIEEAGVGRSTFYDHYSGAEALHLEALKRPFGPLADAAAGQGDEESLTSILAHFWDYRQRARQSINGKSERLLAQMIAERLDGQRLRIPARLAARQLAAAALTPVAAWLSGEASCTPRALAQSICRAGTAQAEALRS